MEERGMVGIKCDECGEEQPATQQDNYPDGGWSLPYETFGYYGGFDDNIGVLLGEDKPNDFILCHDCVVKLLTALPVLGAKLVGGHHPNWVHDDGFDGSGDDGTVHPSCCRWAWTWKRVGASRYEVDTYYGDGNGGWVLGYKHGQG